MNTLPTLPDVSIPVTAPRASSRLLPQLLGAAALGLVVLYAVGFATSPLAHNAAHDVRHFTATPCH